ncbi:MAG TPA: NUDIX hydrolase [Sedimentisphaerales bacterium]|nr:NUDIX hydrolase [Sedimentisphaerales bacterium]
MNNNFELNKLTSCKWLNLFEVFYSRKNKRKQSWMMCSRKDKPITDAGVADAVVIIPVIKTEAGVRLVVTKEFRVPIWDYEYGFPAGLIDDGEDIAETIKRELKEETGLELVKINHISKPVYSSAGLSDESCCMAVVEARGEVSTQWQEPSEDIETILMNVDDIKALLESQSKVAAKAWGILFHYVKTGKIEI